ncbi:MAG: hypothetical protein A7316_08020 [Candidatus Altiarchaeales archaeon WOR_SM1_86-2]|nr:MAG: hypothetical protein A7316_08020 [Candidatus Altiarchaeales archaeon WOR_SM1_86-2]ODS40162.1 MAG: hypothetical protein A7315_09350 [Candidatus Altiarchaeales archaeon WOR_SM1_79]
MEKYKIDITKEAEKWMDKKLNNEQLRRFANKLKKIENFPDKYGKPLRSPLTGIWEIYFEKKFRVLYEIDYESKIVKIITIKHKDEM